MQETIAFPEPLTDKYRPARIEDFAGLDKQRRILARFAANPYPSAWLFTGASGTGKSSMALAVANEIGAEIIHVPAKECDLQRVQEIARQCSYVPMQGPKGFWAVIVDEIDSASEGAMLAWLSKLDATAPLGNAVTIFTSNGIERLEKRFLSRCRVLEFSTYGMSNSICDFLQRVWDSEVDSPTERPNFARLVKDCQSNIRDCMNKLELEIMGA